MNHIISAWGLAAWKPLFTALLLPPTPFLFIGGLGVWLSSRQPLRARLVVAASATLIWFSGSSAVAQWLSLGLLPKTSALSTNRIRELRSHATEPVAIIVLGSGLEQWAPEYSANNLSPSSLDRLRYGIWLSRQTGWPLGFSGGIGWGQTPDSTAAEATIAQRIASEEWGHPLRWVEPASRDTHENAVDTMAMLKPVGIHRVLLVTHFWHMPRAMRNFTFAADASVHIEAAPMGLSKQEALPLLQWLPSGEGVRLTREVIRERLGLWFGA